MECEPVGYGESGSGRRIPAWQGARRNGLERVLELGVGVRLADAADLSVAVGAEGARIPRLASLSFVAAVPDAPFMNTMDEISYWVHTKRAPCLMSYDNLLKKQGAVGECSKPKSVPSVIEDVPSSKRKKRKLSLLDAESTSLEKQQNLYFETSQDNPRLLYGSHSETVKSDIDFNIKSSFVWDKPKRIRLQKSSKTVLHKKNKVITSTPNPKLTTTVRRSLRKVQNNDSKNGLLNSSIEDVNLSADKCNAKCTPSKSAQKAKRCSAKAKFMNLATENGTKTKTEVIVNGTFEDLSDVSGFTANYIRSTKLLTVKTHRNLRSKGRRPVKETQTSFNKDESKMLICVNKSINAASELPTHLNCSTEPSNNAVNLVSLKSHDKNLRVNKSTSILKFMDVKCKNKESNNHNTTESSKTKSKSDLINTSFQSSTSRYPRRHTGYHSITESTQNPKYGLMGTKSSDKKWKSGINACKFNDSDRKENPEETYVSKTRSGRNIRLALRQHENSVLVYSNSTEQESSVPNLNVACQSNRKKRKSILKCAGPAKKSADRSVSRGKDSMREASGFTACFSDSEDSEPLKPRKYFC